MADRRRGQGGLGEAVLGDLDLLRPQRGRVRSGVPGSGFRFTPQASQLWRFALGSNAAVIKKISRGGTHSKRELQAQVDYLFSKSAAIFGNAVVLDPKARGLSTEERKEIAETWSEGWYGSTKNGQTTHLLLSFPSHVQPKKAKAIAEEWAFEMFQSGDHQDEEWAYVAALHTDRPHPHVHIVVNNRGLARDAWFFMAKEHHFNLAMMKSRMVEIAAEEGVLLDATSRVERGILSYGPSRGEIEQARAEGREPVERPREGRALQDALASVSKTAETLRGLAHAAALTGLKEIAERIGEAETRLRQGGILHPIPAQSEHVDRADLERHFGAWMAQASERISGQPAAQRDELRKELYGYAADIARDLGDRRGAELMALPPRTPLYGTAWADLDHDALPELVKSGVEIGLGAVKLEQRLTAGAANAFEERRWLTDDLRAISARQQLDLQRTDDQQTAVQRLESLTAKAAQLEQHARARSEQEQADPLLRSLRTMANVFPMTGKMAFSNDDQARNFATDLRKRYGDGIARDLAAGRTTALAQDFPEEQDRDSIAAAFVSAAKAHAGMGLTLQEARQAERKREPFERDRDWEL